LNTNRLRLRLHQRKGIGICTGNGRGSDVSEWWILFFQIFLAASLNVQKVNFHWYNAENPLLSKFARWIYCLSQVRHVAEVNWTTIYDSRRLEIWGMFLLYKHFSRMNNPPEKSVVGATPSVPSDFLRARMLKTHSFSAQLLVFRHKMD